MFEHALNAPVHADGHREEACGIVAGENGQPVRFIPVENVEHSPTRYRADDRDVLRIQRELDQGELDILGIFHSHTHTAAYPSSTDVTLAIGWPDQIFLIASLMHEQPRLRAFWIRNGKVEEEEISFLEA